MRYLTRSTFHNIVKRLVDSPKKQRVIISSPTDSVEYQCYKQSVKKFKKYCRNIRMVKRKTSRGCSWKQYSVFDFLQIQEKNFD